MILQPLTATILSKPLSLSHPYYYHGLLIISISDLALTVLKKAAKVIPSKYESDHGTPCSNPPKPVHFALNSSPRPH